MKGDRKRNEQPLWQQQRINRSKWETTPLSLARSFGALHSFLDTLFLPVSFLSLGRRFLKTPALQAATESVSEVREAETRGINKEAPVPVVRVTHTTNRGYNTSSSRRSNKSLCVFSDRSSSSCLISCSFSVAHSLAGVRRGRRRGVVVSMGRAPCCDRAAVKRGPWSPEEDDKLRDYIQRHGTGGSWITFPKKAGQH